MSQSQAHINELKQLQDKLQPRDPTLAALQGNSYYQQLKQKDPAAAAQMENKIRQNYYANLTPQMLQSNPEFQALQAQSDPRAQAMREHLQSNGAARRQELQRAGQEYQARTAGPALAQANQMAMNMAANAGPIGRTFPAASQGKPTPATPPAEGKPFTPPASLEGRNLGPELPSPGQNAPPTQSKPAPVRAGAGETKPAPTRVPSQAPATAAGSAPQQHRALPGVTFSGGNLHLTTGSLPGRTAGPRRSIQPRPAGAQQAPSPSPRSPGGVPGSNR